MQTPPTYTKEDVVLAKFSQLERVIVGITSQSEHEDWKEVWQASVFRSQLVLVKWLEIG